MEPGGLDAELPLGVEGVGCHARHPGTWYLRRYCLVVLSSISLRARVDRSVPHTAVPSLQKRDKIVPPSAGCASKVLDDTAHTR